MQWIQKRYPLLRVCLSRGYDPPFSWWSCIQNYDDQRDHMDVGTEHLFGWRADKDRISNCYLCSGRIWWADRKSMLSINENLADAFADDYQTVSWEKVYEQRSPCDLRFLQFRMKRKAISTSRRHFCISEHAFSFFLNGPARAAPSSRIEWKRLKRTRNTSFSTALILCLDGKEKETY